MPIKQGGASGTGEPSKGALAGDAPADPGSRRYWRDHYTLNTWKSFRRSSGKVASFRESDRRHLGPMKPGDYLLCYLADAERWVGVLEVDGYPFPARPSPPSRARGRTGGLAGVPVIPVAVLSPETGVPFAILEDRPETVRLRTDGAAGERRSGGGLKSCDRTFGEAVAAAVVEKARDLALRPSAPAAPALDLSGEPRISENPTLHTEIQWLLAKLGDDMGLHVWVARNDRHRDFKGHRFTGLARLVDALPVQFDAKTTRTVELIDVLWLQGKAIVSAFEIESTTSIYTGLLRMADLVAMQPNLNIPLFLVAGAERRAKVLGEVNRPAFSRLNPPLNQICRFIAFETLRARLSAIEGFARHMNPSFLAEVSEACARETDSPDREEGVQLSRSSPG
ncbi:MAG: hypothetical protein EXQ86_08120 [Rhodospirillales bacterium]|nr:hypothetical protein [Rhodospirillales bacterium]